MIRDSDEFAAAASDLLDEERYEDALEIIRQGLRQFPGDGILRFLEASTLGELGHHPLARDILEQLRREDFDGCDSSLFFAELMGSYLNLGRKKDAIQCVRDAIRRADFDEDTAHLMAEQLHDHGLDSESAMCAVRAIKLNPHSDDGWLNLAFATYGLGRTTAAEFCCNRALKVCPGHLIALDLLGIIYFDGGRIDEAAECWGRIPIKDHFDSASLVAWRSVLKHDDPKVRSIRKRWSELRDEESREDVIRMIMGSRKH